jgi:hypothetical protein
VALFFYASFMFLVVVVRVSGIVAVVVIRVVPASVCVAVVCRLQCGLLLSVVAARVREVI